MFFRKIQNQKPCGSRSWLLKALWIQELTPEKLLGPERFQEPAPGSTRSQLSSWIQRVFRSQLLDPERFQEPAPGSTWFSGVSSWIQSSFRSQLLDPKGFQESIPGSKWFLVLNFPEKHHQENVFFFKILMINVLFFLIFSCYFLCVCCMFFSDFITILCLFFHFLVLFLCFFGCFLIQFLPIWSK